MTDEQIEIKKMPKVVAGVYVFNDKGEVLLVRAPHWANKFLGLGGHVEYREKTIDAAVREMKEETGLDIKDLELIKILEVTNPLDYGKNQTHLVSFNYRARLTDENQPIILDKTEGTEYIWIKPEDAVELADIEPVVVEVLDALIGKKEKKNWFGKDDCKKCEEAKKECDEYKMGWQRALADYKNLQAETSKRRGEWAQLSEQQILEEFIPVYDHLKMSIAGVDKSDAWVEGVKHVLRQFVDILKNHGVEEIKTVGEKFDPKYHEAAGEEMVEGAEPGVIIKEIMPGYKMGERVIRAARVIVAK